MHTKAVYVVLGITVEGEKELLGLWRSETEGAQCWLSVFTDLKSGIPTGGAMVDAADSGLESGAESVCNPVR